MKKYLYIYVSCCAVLLLISASPENRKWMVFSFIGGFVIFAAKN